MKSRVGAGLVLVGALVGCPGGGDEPEDDTQDSGGEETGETAETGGGDSTETGPEDTGPFGPYVLGDTNNYSFSGELDGPTVRTRSATDLHIDWSALTLDMQCHGMDPVADTDNLALLAFPYLSEAEVEDGLEMGTLLQSDLGGYVQLELGDQTEAMLSELTFFGTDADIETRVEEGAAAFLVILTTGTSVGIGTRSFLFVEPHVEETNTEVVFGDSCAILDFEADLEALQPVPVNSTGPWVVDWSGLTTNGQDLPFDLRNIDGLMLGHYPGRSPADLEAEFLDLELVTDEIWRAELNGETSVDLASLERDGVPFPGFAGEGTWLLGLRCSTCANPAPLFLTVLEPG